MFVDMHQIQIEHFHYNKLVNNIQMNPSSDKSQVYSLRPLINMKFRLTSQKSLSLKKNDSNLIEKQKNKKNQSSFSNKLKDKMFEFKFCEKITDNHLLIGNQYQLVLLDFTHMTEDYMEILSLLTITQNKFITGLTVLPKLRKIIVICGSILHCYGYREQNIQSSFVQYNSLQMSDPIDAVYLMKIDTIIIFHCQYFSVYEVYNENEIFKMVKIQTFRYRETAFPRFLSVPENQGEKIIVFFEENQQENKKQEININLKATLRILWYVQIRYNHIHDITVSKLQKYGVIPFIFNSEISIKLSHYKNDIFILQNGCQLFAIKYNYIIDKIKFNFQNKPCHIKIIGKNQLIYQEDDVVDIYHYQLNQTRKPEQFQTKCIDNLSLKSIKPKDSTYYTTLKLGKNIVTIYQQKKSIMSNQINFWIGVAQSTNKSQKIKQIFPQKLPNSAKEINTIVSEKVSIAEKIGFNQNEAFLQLWNRSSKTTKKDYELLIATEDYDMIQQQIQKKIKKKSLRYHEIEMVIRSALEMLKQKIIKQCSVQVIRQFALCHFLCCKISMFQEISRLSLKDQSQSFVISIQDYYYLGGLELQKQLIELINQLCLEKKPVVIKIKALLRQFALIYRLIYPSILPKIVKNIKQHLLILLQQVPQILPLQSSYSQDGQGKGLWKQIDLQLNPNYFILENYSRFQTEKYFQEFKTSKFFIVHKWHTHGAISASKEQITKTLNLYNNNFIFTLIFESLYSQKQKIGGRELHQLINQIENYTLLPDRLRGKFIFYCKLYQNFKDYYLSQRKSFITPFQFFSLNQRDLFQLYFKKQREKKGIFILKEIIPIYQFSMTGGKKQFLNNMFHFFQTTQSSWSDLKIVLNKFNTEKQDFHRKHYQIFQVIVKAIMQKVWIGTDDPQQVKLGQVISYIQNIPFPFAQSQLLYNLVSLRELQQQEQLLKKIKINMNLRSILERGEEVIYEIMTHQIQRNKIRTINNPKEMLAFATKVMAEVSFRKTNLYMEQHPNFVYKSFLLILLEEEKFIPICKTVIQDSFLRNFFHVQTKLIQNIVLYLYRKRLFSNPNYSQSKQYINLLVQLTHPQSNKAKFIVLSQAFAKIFTFQIFKIQYPFFMRYYPTVKQIQRLINSLNKNQIRKIDYKHLFDIVFMLKVLGQEYENIKETVSHRFTNKQGIQKKNLMMHEIYTLVFLKFHKQELITQAIQIASIILRIVTENQAANIIFPVFLIETLLSQLLVRSHQPITRLISYYFYEHDKFLQIIMELTTAKGGYSTIQIDEFIENKQQEMNYNLIINIHNNVLSQQFKKYYQTLPEESQTETVNAMFENIWKQIKQRRQQYVVNPIYNIIYRILLHDPFVLTEYIFRKRRGINVKSLRALFTLLGFQSTFNMRELFRVCKAIFQILMIKIQSEILLSDVIQNYTPGSILDEDLYFTQDYIRAQVKLSVKDLLGSSIMIMDAKMKILQENVQIQKNQQTKYKQIIQLKENPQLYHKRKLEQSHYILQKLKPHQIHRIKAKHTFEIMAKDQLRDYPFNDTDNQYTQAKYDLELPVKIYQPNHATFDQVSQRSQSCQNLPYAQKQTFLQRGLRKTNYGYCEFDALYRQKFLGPVAMKVSTVHRQRFKRMNSKNISISEPNENDQNFFQSICVQGGFVSMLKKAQNGNIPVSPGTLLGNSIKQSIIQEQDNPTTPISQERPVLENIDEDMFSYIQNHRDFCGKIQPSFGSENERNQYFESLVFDVYRRSDYNFTKRVLMLWYIKKQIFKIDFERDEIYLATIRLINSEYVNTILVPLQQIFPEVLFIQKMSLGTLLQLIKENVNEKVVHEQDIIKLAELVAEMFDIPSIKDEILIMFLIKFCRKFIRAQQTKKNIYKNEILYLMSCIQPQKLNQSIGQLKYSYIQDLNKIYNLLVHFKNYQYNDKTTPIL